jgi:hypothetical protein
MLAFPPAMRPRDRGWIVLVAAAALGFVGSTGCRRKPDPIAQRSPPRAASVTVSPRAPIHEPAEAKAAAALTPDAAAGEPVVREEAKVTVDGKTETWRLVWRTPPKLACVEANEWWACPCNGFAFGEEGSLDVVRTRSDGSEDRLALDEKMVQRWIPTKAETDAAMRAGIARGATDGDAGAAKTRAELEGHQIAKVLNIGDYDHDGRATEFVLQVSAGPCWHKEAVLVGLERTNERLHVFVDETPEPNPDPSLPSDPEITLEPSDWEKARVALPRTFIRVPCGDHGAMEAQLLTLTRGPAGLRAKKHTRRCP